MDVTNVSQLAEVVNLGGLLALCVIVYRKLDQLERIEQKTQRILARMEERSRHLTPPFGVPALPAVDDEKG